MRHPRNKARYSVRQIFAHLDLLQPAECTCGAGDSLACELPCTEAKRRQVLKRVAQVVRHLAEQQEQGSADG